MYPRNQLKLKIIEDAPAIFYTTAMIYISLYPLLCFFLHRLCANSAQRNMSCLQLSTSRGFCKMFCKIFLMALKVKKILFALLKSRLFSYQEDDHTVDMIHDTRFLAC